MIKATKNLDKEIQAGSTHLLEGGERAHGGAGAMTRIRCRVGVPVTVAPSLPLLGGGIACGDLADVGVTDDVLYV